MGVLDVFSVLIMVMVVSWACTYVRTYKLMQYTYTSFIPEAVRVRVELSLYAKHSARCWELNNNPSFCSHFEFSVVFVFF